MFARAWKLQVAADGLVESLKPGMPGTAVDPDMRSALYQTAAHGSARPHVFFDHLRKMYLAATAADERYRTLRALAYSPLAVPAALNFSLTPDVRAQDVAGLVTAAAAQADAVAAPAVWAWVAERWGDVHAKLGGEAAEILFPCMFPSTSSDLDVGLARKRVPRALCTLQLSAPFCVRAGDAEASRRMGQVMEAVASRASNRTMLAQVDALFAAHRAQLGDAGWAHAARAKESIAANAAWVERHGEDLCAWVAAQAAP